VVPITSYFYRSMTTGTIGRLPISFLVFLLVAGLTYLLLNRSYSAAPCGRSAATSERRPSPGCR
jgi:hypothetical protein